MTVKEMEERAAKKADLVKVRKIIREQAETLAANTSAAARAALRPTRSKL